MIQYTYQHRVRYRECDPMGVVYHAHYIDYFEAARTEALRENGIVYKSIEADGIMMPVVDLAVKYKKPAFYDDLLDIKATVNERPTIRTRIEYEVRRSGEDVILVTGHVTLCFIDIASRRPVQAPPAYIDLFDAGVSS